MTLVIWEKCQSSLQQELSAQQFNTWIRPLTVEASSDTSSEFCLLAPNRFILDWVTDKFLLRIKELIQDFSSAEQLPAPKTVTVKVSAALQASMQSRFSSKKEERVVVQSTEIPESSVNMEYQAPDSLSENELSAFHTIPVSGQTASFGGITSSTLSGNHIPPHHTDGREPTITEEPSKPIIVGNRAASGEANERLTSGMSGALKHRSGLNKSFTFESFVEGKSNQMGLAAAQQVVENPGGSYNPLFIYGGVGLGKTHLMHAVGNEMAKRNPNAKIVYLHSERFVADMVKALQLNAINDFKRYYRSVDALLIDDIQFFAGKDRSQEEFFHTFNALLEGNQQIILTCDRYPKVINNLEERLKSRFGWGLTIEVEPPELETRAAILLKRAEEVGVDLSYDAAFFIAQRIRCNVRELEGALKRVIANATFTQRPITVELVREALKDLLALQDKQVSITNIQKVVGDYYKIKVADLLSKRRSRSVARPRQVAMSLAKELTNHSLPEIGDAFGGRDHTTVLHACRKIKELCDIDNDIQQDLKNLQRLLTT